MTSTNSSSTSLRKACRSCTKSKRRCIIELPKCRRCRQRNLECVYDLQPILAKEAPLDQNANRFQGATEPAKDHHGKYEFLDFISSLHMSDKIQAFGQRESLYPGNRRLWVAMGEVPVTTDPEDTRYIIVQLLHLPALVRRGCPTSFVHPQLYAATLVKYLDIRSWGHDFSDDSVTACFIPDTKTVPLIDLVAATQALILFLIQHVFDGKKEGSPRRGFDLLARYRVVLCTTAMTRMPSDLSPWHAWILAESIRRTILMSFLLDGTFSAWKNGWCCHSLFISALPFSAKGQLWLAETEEEWSALTDHPNNAGDLIFYHKFADDFTRTPWDFGDDMLQQLLLVSHHGKTAVDERLQTLRCS